MPRLGGGFACWYSPWYFATSKSRSLRQNNGFRIHPGKLLRHQFTEQYQTDAWSTRDDARAPPDQGRGRATVLTLFAGILEKSNVPVR